MGQYFKQILWVLLCAPTLLLAACEQRDARAQFKPRIETAQLDNGLQIIVIPDSRAGVVTHMVWYRAGAVDEPLHKSGIAHFFEHLMFRGTSNDPEGAFSKIVAAAGGQQNAFTSSDVTAYFQRIASDRLEQMMALEADRMAHLIINEERVAIERDVILEERALRTDSNPQALLSEKMRARAHAGTAYGVPIIGWRDEIAALNADDARAFYQAHYHPDNAVLVVAGDSDIEEVVRLATAHYGAIPKRVGEIGEKVEGQVLPIIADNLEVENWQTPLVLRDERTRQAVWQRIYRLPVFDAAQGGDFAALDVASDILAGDFNSRLYQRLVVERGLASDVGIGVDSIRRGVGELVIRATLTHNDGGDFAAIASVIDEEIAALAAGDIDSDKMAVAQLNLVSALIFARDSQQAMAQVFGQAAALGFSPENVLEYPRDIERVGARDVARVVKAWLQPQFSLTGHLLPNERSERREN